MGTCIAALFAAAFTVRWTLPMGYNLLQLNYSTLPQIPFSTLEWSHSLGAAVLMMNLRDEVGAPTVLRQRSARKRAARTGALGGALLGEMLGGVASASVPGSVRLRPFHEW